MEASLTLVEEQKKRDEFKRKNPNARVDESKVIKAQKKADECLKEKDRLMAEQVQGPIVSSEAREPQPANERV